MYFIICISGSYVMTKVCSNVYATFLIICHRAVIYIFSAFARRNEYWLVINHARRMHINNDVLKHHIIHLSNKTITVNRLLYI